MRRMPTNEQVDELQKIIEKGGDGLKSTYNFVVHKNIETAETSTWSTNITGELLYENIITNHNICVMSLVETTSAPSLAKKPQSTLCQYYDTGTNTGYRQYRFIRFYYQRTTPFTDEMQAKFIIIKVADADGSITFEESDLGSFETKPYQIRLTYRDNLPNQEGVITGAPSVSEMVALQSTPQGLNNTELLVEIDGENQRVYCRRHNSNSDINRYTWIGIISPREFIQITFMFNLGWSGYKFYAVPSRPYNATIGDTYTLKYKRTDTDLESIYWSKDN